MAANEDYMKAMAILLTNQDKPFVDRVLNRDKYPVLPLPGGGHATHKMAWGETDGKYLVYPTVQWDGKNLVEYSGGDAFKRALAAGDYIEFETPEEADWFSKNYKAVWGSK